MTSGAPTTEERGLDQLLRDLEALEALADGWGDAERKGAKARAEAVDALNAEAFRRLIRGLRDVPGMAAALRDAAGDEVIYAVLRRHGILKPSLYERVDQALETVRPMLKSHGGNAELVAVEGARAEVRFLGACDGCPASALTFYAGVKKAIQDHVPEITEIKQAKGLGGGDGVHFTSPFAAYQKDGWSYAADLEGLPDGATRILDVDGHSVLLSRFGDRVTCFENACAHMGMALDGGEIKDGLITCPYHGFQYALETGECLTAPEVQLQPHGARVVGERIEVRLTA
jgi:nitrite reductase/ring-hydroxylating ferredoxin subunit/Fe-S cluster biogenesis protein NfuA